jgi:predicted DNA-binding protein
MSLMERRVQILIEHAEYQRLERVARADHRSVASVIREAIGQYLNTGADDKARALDALLDMAVDRGAGEDWNDAKQALEDTRTRLS